MTTFTFVTILIVLAAVLMILIVLVQNSKGGGLASGFASSNQIMGVRKTTDFLEKATWTLAATIVILSIVSAAFISNGTENSSAIQESIIEEATINSEIMNNIEEGASSDITNN
ncbi:MAG: preprotein translocase subunit SecG [Muribaculaceae bacterium]|nr:preprotein translocase subunit SecG [Muribaculaceae bacterium]